ncbi:MAG: hypothetical protein V1726_05105 [Methanobacteriota archaeon]
MDVGYLILSGTITIISCILLAVSLHSYRVFGNKKLYFVVLVFLFFFIKGLLLTVGVFFNVIVAVMTSYYIWIIDLIILTLLYISALKK